MPKKLTGFERMWNAYPAPGGGAEEAKQIIGGEAGAKWVSNTCVVRVSRAMNYAGHPIPMGYPGLSTVRGADGLRYAIRVEEFRKFLTQMYGPPAVNELREQPIDEVPASLQGKVGILMFLVKGWVDATGHVDLWDGEACRHQAYFNKASQILLWCVATTGEPKLAAGASPVPISGSVGQGGANKPEDVARVQALLAARGLDVGPTDGAAGPRTIQAIADLQKRFLATVDGRVDPNGRTWRELNGL